MSASRSASWRASWKRRAFSSAGATRSASSSDPAEVVVAEPRLRVAGEDAEPADPAGAVDERNAERGPDRLPRPSPRDSGTRARPRARPSSPGWPKNDVASGCSLPKPREPTIGFVRCRRLRRAARGRRRRRGSASGGVERRLEDVVEVDRRPDLIEEPAALRLLLGATHALLQLARELLHPRLELADRAGLRRPASRDDARRGPRGRRRRREQTARATASPSDDVNPLEV